MKIGFFVSNLNTEGADYATTIMARTAFEFGHEIWYITANDFEYDSNELVRANAKSVNNEKFSSGDAFLAHLRSEKNKSKKIVVDELDVLMLRNDPTEDSERPWAQHIGITFGKVAAQHGVIVVNDPSGLSMAMNKLYFQQFPEGVRPKTLISRNADDIKRFIKEENYKAVIKPLQGSGGKNVFSIQNNDTQNINQIIDAVTRDGYAIVQEYLTEAKNGDTRLFMMNGMPLEKDGKFAALIRTQAPDDIRSNMHVGGKAKIAKISDKALMLTEMVRPKLVEDGMFLVGLDIVGDKLMEINVFSPGGLSSIASLTGINFSEEIIKALERKVEYAKLYYKNINNKILATL
jgi:glutathione synthase